MSQANQRRDIAGTRSSRLSSVKQFRLLLMRAEVKYSTVYRIYREFLTAGALTLKALADNANDMRGTVSNSLSTAFRVIVIDQVRQVGWGRDYSGLVCDDCQLLSFVQIAPVSEEICEMTSVAPSCVNVTDEIVCVYVW